MTNPAYRLLDAEEFFEIDFGAERKAELDQGVIRMMAGGTRAHARVQANVLAWLRQALRGSGCRPYGSDMALKTGRLSVRYPDVSVVCGDAAKSDDDRVCFDQATAVFEIFSPSNSASRDLLARVVRVSPLREATRATRTAGSRPSLPPRRSRGSAIVE
jgi:Uma2 family endonuclease